MTESPQGASPKTPRYFYPASRAHHAYCMAIDHGMKFKTTKGGIWKLEGLRNIPLHSSYQIEVAEESLPLLEPTAGDLVAARNDFAQYLAFVQPDGLHKCNYHLPDVILSQNGESPFRVTSILQRDGKPFMWPEREAV